MNWFNILKFNESGGSVGRKLAFDKGEKLLRLTEEEYAHLGHTLALDSQGNLIEQEFRKISKQPKKQFHNWLKYYYLVAWRYLPNSKKLDLQNNYRKHAVAEQNIELMPGTRFRATFDRRGNNVSSRQPQAPSGMIWNYKRLDWMPSGNEIQKKIRVNYGNLRLAILKEIEGKDKIYIRTELYDNIIENYRNIVQEQIDNRAVSQHVNRLTHSYLRTPIIKTLKQEGYLRDKSPYYLDGQDTPYAVWRK